MLRYRLAVASRAAAAIFGGYALASALAACLAVWLPGPRTEAVLAATMLAFLAHACVALWVFATRSAVRAWAGVAGVTAVLAGLYMLARLTGSA